MSGGKVCSVCGSPHPYNVSCECGEGVVLPREQEEGESDSLSSDSAYAPEPEDEAMEDLPLLECLSESTARALLARVAETTLLTMRKEHRQKLRNAGLALVNNDGDLDEEEVAAKVCEIVAYNAISQIYQKVLGDIENALERIDSGAWGFCDRCRRPIAIARLLALPYACTCMGCNNHK